MYDPEEAMAEEERINTVREVVAETQELFSEKYPRCAEFYRLIGEGFERLHQLSQDLDSCFDPDERESISKEGREIIAIIDKAMNDRFKQLDK